MKKALMFLLFAPFLISSKCKTPECIKRTVEGDLNNDGLKDKVIIEYYPSGKGYLKVYTSLKKRTGGYYAPQLVMKAYSSDILSRLREEPPKDLEIKLIDDDEFPDLKFTFWSLAGTEDYETYCIKGNGAGRFIGWEMMEKEEDSRFAEDISKSDKRKRKKQRN